MLKLCLLGAFQVLKDGQPVTGFVSNKVRALLAYLAAESDRPHSREALMGLLWPDWPQSSAQGNLRYALSNLRKLLKPEQTNLLTTSRQAVQFHCTENVWLDLAVFQEQTGNDQIEPAALAALEAAAALYHGEFLEGLIIDDSAVFEEWRTVRREQFHRQMLDMLHIISRTYIERGEYNQALRYAWRQLELEPWNEEAYQQIMRALTLNGQRDAALAQYERCRRVLEQELDIEPSAETTGLYEDIRAGKLINAKVRRKDEKWIVSSNVPFPLTSFVGRQHEIAEIGRLITSSAAGSKPATRLLTLTGAGGCGKTRLAIESTRPAVIEDCFPNGVWWVDLAPVNNPLLVTQTMATVLGLREIPGTTLMTSLTNYLRTKQILILLDNCEHLIDACARLAETVLMACPGLRVLATSREAFDIDGEKTFPVHPLSFPDPVHLPPMNELLDYEAVRLFVERAENVLPGFTLTHKNAASVIQICHQLDGIPLAIELAAIRLKTMPVEEVAARIDDRFQLLTNGHRTALPYHRTLRGVIDWSYDFLSEEERSLFCQLSIFSGGWTAESAAQITAGYTFEILTALVNKSLVLVEPTGGTARYRMLDTIRHYAWEKLSESGQEESLGTRHLEFFLRFAERSWKELRGGDQKLWMDLTHSEQDNIRKALEWSLRSSKKSTEGLRLAVAMSEFWLRCNYYREERQWLERALALSAGACPPQLRAWTNVKLAACTFYLGDFEAMQGHLDLAWEGFGNLEDDGGIAIVLQGRAALAGEQKNDLALARTCLEESRILLQTMGDRWELAETLRDLGHVFFLQRDYFKARSCLNEAMQLSRETSNPLQLSRTLYHLGLVDYIDGDHPSARSHFNESRRLAEEYGDRDDGMDVLSGLGEMARAEHNFQQAQTYYEEGLFLARELGAEYAIAVFLQGTGHVALHFGDCQRATRDFEESLQYFLKQNMRQRMSGSLLGLAGVALAHGDMEQAARLSGKVDALIKETGSQLLPANREEYNQTVSMVRANLGERRFNILWQEGYGSNNGTSSHLVHNEETAI